MKIDEINVAIIQHLKDGRVPFKQIAEKLGVSEGTIRARVKKLQDEGVLEITGLINPDVLPDKYVVMVGVKLKDMDLVKKAEEFRTFVKGEGHVAVFMPHPILFC